MAGDLTRIVDEDWDIVEGWLHVWESDRERERRVQGEVQLLSQVWEPAFVTLVHENTCLTFHPSEQAAQEDEVNLTVNLCRRIRLDGGTAAFGRRWGYDILEAIEENTSPVDDDSSAESFFRTRTHLDDSMGSISDIPRDEDTPRTPALLRKFFMNSSAERVDGERRGSLPLVSTIDDSMESVTTTSRLANFFSRRGIKTNLKRTKSVTKLDRKRSSPNLSDHDSTSLMGSLKRTMSLGRLTRKKNKKESKEQQKHEEQQQQQQLQYYHPYHHHHSHPYHHHVQESKQPPHRRQSSASSSSQLNSPHGSPSLSLLNSRIRSARSHESLLASPPSMHSIDLSAPDVEVKPLHSSVLGQGHCFHVATSQGSKYISCTTSEERDKWLSSLRRTIRPNEEQSRRHDSSLKLWIVEAKNVTPKKSYYCTILLDRTLYAQTSVRTMADMLFWGEHFQFKNLPAVEIITINLFREPDRKKKKDKSPLPVGYISLSMKEMDNNQMMEKWITCCSSTVGKGGKDGKTELPIIRIKARRQRVDILPLDAYQDFLKYLTNEYSPLSQMLEATLAVREKEEFATSLIHILQTQSKACEFLLDIIMDEIDRLEDEHLTFRGNSIATKAMEAFMKLVGEKYLRDTLGEFIRQLIQSPDDCEVDPTKVTPQQLPCQQKNLEMYCHQAWAKVMNSFCYFPNEMREVFANVRSRCTDKGKADYSNNLISGCIFLRFLCPAILSPSLFNLTQEYPQEKASRNLTLIAKTIQTLANFTQFGSKEEFMTFMNKFVETEEESMKTFLLNISSQDAGNEFLTFDGHIDLGKELAVLHILLLEYRKKYKEAWGTSFEQLGEILDKLSKAFDDPTVGQQKQARRSQIYDNLVHIPSPSKPTSENAGETVVINKNNNNNSSSNIVSREQPNSPTGKLTDMIDLLNHFGGSTDNLSNQRSKKSQNTLDVSRERASSEANLATPKSMSRSRSASAEDEEDKRDGGARKQQQHPPVGDVSVVSGKSRVVYNQEQVNESWSQMVSAADNVNGDYIDLIPFMDEDIQNSTIQTDSVKSSNNNQAQPLAFANPLFNHQQQKQPQSQQHQQPQQEASPIKPAVAPRPLNSRPTPRRPPGPALSAPKPIPQQRLTVGQATTVRRPSSDSSESSDDDNGKKTSSAQVDTTTRMDRIGQMDIQPRNGQPFRPPTTTTNIALAASADYQASIAPLKKLSQLSSSSSEDSLPDTSQGYRQNNSRSVISKQSSSSIASHHSSAGVMSTSCSSGSSLRNQSQFTQTAVTPFTASGDYSGCSTFPRKHQRNMHRFDATNKDSNDVSPPLPPREAFNSSSSNPHSSSSSSSSSSYQRHSMFQRQYSHQQYSSTVNQLHQPPARQPASNRTGVTTNSTGHVQHRTQASANIRSTSMQKSSSVDGGPLGGGDKPIPAAKPQNHGVNRTNAGFENSGCHSSPALNSSRNGINNAKPNTAGFKAGRTNAFSSNNINNNNNTSGTNPGPPPWQTASHVERSSSSQETSSSSDSSPQSLLRSAQHNTSSMHESSSTHSISSAPGYTTTSSASASQTWGYTPPHSDSSSSLSSLNRNQARKAPPRSDSSGSLGNAAVSRTSQTPSGSNSSLSSGNNNTGVRQLDNSRLTRHRDSLTNAPPPNSPNSFATRLSSRSDSQINRSTLQQQSTHHSSSTTSKFNVNNPIALSMTSSSTSGPLRSVSYHSPTDSPIVSSKRTSPYPASRSMDLSHLATLATHPSETSKRASTDSTLSQPDSLSPTGSLSREDLAGGQSSSSSSSTATNRRLSPQSTVHMGISSVQRKLQEQERTKQEYEQEVHILRQQLLEAQERLQQAEMRLLDHEVDTHELMDEWQSRLVESEEKLRRQQAEKDEQMMDIVARLQTVEDELRKEQEEMANAVEHKQQVIEIQEKRIRGLDLANHKLLQALSELKGKARTTAQMANDDPGSYNGLAGLTMEVAGFKTSSC